MGITHLSAAHPGVDRELGTGPQTVGMISWIPAFAGHERMGLIFHIKTAHPDVGRDPETGPPAVGMIPWIPKHLGMSGRGSTKLLLIAD